MGTWLHSVGSWVGRQLGTADTGTIPPPTRAQITSLLGPPPHQLDPTQDHILSQVFSPPYQGPLELDRYGAETPEMRHRFRTLYRTSPVLRSAVRGKADDLCCLQPTLMPADKDDALSATAAKFVDWAVTNAPGGWPGLLDTIYTPATLDGWSVAEKKLRPAVWKGRPVWGLAHVRGIDTTHLRLQLDPFLNVVGVVNVLRGLECYPPEQVLLYSHNPLYGNPFGQSDIRAATRAAEIISDVYKVWYVALKVYGLPYMKGKVSDPTRRKHMEAALKALRDGGWVVLPSKEDEIEVLNLSAAAALSGFEQMVHAQREDIFFAVRGAAQPFMEGDGGASAHTDTSVQQEASNAGEQRLAGAVADVINRQLIPWLVAPNFELPEDRMPRLKLGGTNWANVKDIVGIIRDAQGVGLEVSAEWAHEATGMPAPRDPQDRLVTPQEEQQQQPPPGAGVAGGDGAAMSADARVFADPPMPTTDPGPGLKWELHTDKNSRKVWKRVKADGGHAPAHPPGAPANAASSPKGAGKTTKGKKPAPANPSAQGSTPPAEPPTSPPAGGGSPPPAPPPAPVAPATFPANDPSWTDEQRHQNVLSLLPQNPGTGNHKDAAAYQHLSGLHNSDLLLIIEHVAHQNRGASLSGWGSRANEVLLNRLAPGTPPALIGSNEPAWDAHWDGADVNFKMITSHRSTYSDKFSSGTVMNARRDQKPAERKAFARVTLVTVPGDPDNKNGLYIYPDFGSVRYGNKDGNGWPIRVPLNGSANQQLRDDPEGVKANLANTWNKINWPQVSKKMDAEEHQVALNEAKAVSGVIEAAEGRGAAQGEELAREYGNQIGEFSPEATAAFFQALAQKPEKITQAVRALPDEHKAKTAENLLAALPDEHKAKTAENLLAALPDEALKAYPPEVAAWIRAQRQPPAAPPPS